MDYLRPLNAVGRHLVIVILVAIAAALLVPAVFAPFADHTAKILSAVFFISALRISVREVWRDLRDPYLLLVTAIWLVAAPLLVWTAASAVAPAFAMAALLLAVTPSGMAAPLLVGAVGGRTSMAMVYTVVTSFLAPVTVPLMISLLAGAEVSVDAWGMFASIATIIVVPFAAARLVSRVFPKAVAATVEPARGVSSLLLGLLVAGILAEQAPRIWSDSFGDILVGIAVLTVLLAFFGAAGWLTMLGRDRKDRITHGMSVSLLNFTLALYLAREFFPDPRTVIPIAFSSIPWVMTIIVWRAIAKRSKFCCVKE